MAMTTGRAARWLLLTVPIIFLPLLLWRSWPQPREVIYDLYRERGRAKTLSALRGYESGYSDHFEVLVRQSDEDVADMILETAEKAYKPVIQAVGYKPEGTIPLIVYPTRGELRQAFGWGNGESAMGVYWSGTIRLLSPNVWIDEENQRERLKVFQKLNPIAHELTHYVLDYMTDGNYPRWFTEGLAQRVEYKVSGFLWIEEESTLDQDLYTLPDLHESFDSLQNQPLAYRQSFLLVDYMAQTYGERALKNLIASLAEGTEFAEAVNRTFRTPMTEIYADWYDWVLENRDELDDVG